MAYATQSDLLDQLTESELIQLTDDEGKGIIDSGRVTKAINDAAGEIDSYAGTVYKLPLTVTDQVRRLAKIIAIFHLCERRLPVQEDRRKAYEDAIRFLRDISTSKATLNAQDQGTIANQAGGSGGPKPDDREHFSDAEKIVDF